ncbi:MAG: hypothetical protein K0Q55_724, partial [Verrucomicrobia bacterium]|nr:hypothetical protein [Verrucomicrobiota bacterium]
KFTVKEEGTVREILPAGTSITAGLKDGKSTYQIKGEEAAQEVAVGLKTFVSVNDPNKPNDDDISGTKDKKKVGDTWPLNTEMAVKNFALNNLQLKKEDVSGVSKLEGVVTEGDQKLLKISSKIDIKNVAPPLPPGMEVKKSTIQAEFSGLFPLNPAGPRVQSAESMKMDLKAQGKMPDGRMMEISVNSEQKSTKRMKFE